MSINLPGVAIQISTPETKHSSMLQFFPNVSQKSESLHLFHKGLKIINLKK